MVIAHPDEFLHLFIFLCWDMDWAVGEEGKAFCDIAGVTLVILNLFPPLRLWHGCRCKDDAFDIVLSQLVI